MKRKRSSLKVQNIHSRAPFSGVAKTAIASLCSAVMISGSLKAAPYASKVRVTDTTVTFILNEPSDSLTYSINDGPAHALDGSTKGEKSFSLNAPTDKFAITAGKNATVGYTIPTDGTIATSASGLSQPTFESGFNLSGLVSSLENFI